MFRFKTVRGTDVPQEAASLTRGEDGTMLYWLQGEREHMTAVLAYRDNVLVGWCATVRLRRRKWWLWGEEVYYTHRVKIGTFVEPDQRGKGLAKQLLKRMTWTIYIADPKTTVLYGAPKDDAGFFNKTYEKVLADGKLDPSRYYCV